MTDDAEDKEKKEKEKEDALRKAEARLRDEVAAFRRKEEAEQRRVKHGCIGCLTILVLIMVAAFLFS